MSIHQRARLSGLCHPDELTERPITDMSSERALLTNATLGLIGSGEQRRLIGTFAPLPPLSSAHAARLTGVITEAIDHDGIVVMALSGAIDITNASQARTAIEDS